MSKYKTHAFSNAQYLALGKPMVFQGKREENQKSEDIKRLEVVGIWKEAVRKERDRHIKDSLRVLKPSIIAVGMDTLLIILSHCLQEFYISLY